MNPDLPKTFPQRTDYLMSSTGPRWYYNINPDLEKNKKPFVKDLSDRFISEDEAICPVLGMEIFDVKTLNGTLIQKSEWENYFELNFNGSFTVKKFDTPIFHWQIYMIGKNSKI